MTVTVNKSGDTWKEIVYRIHATDPDGELLDLGEYDEPQAAIDRARTLSGEYENVEVEKTTLYFPGRRHENTYKVIWNSLTGATR